MCLKFAFAYYFILEKGDVFLLNNAPLFDAVLSYDYMG